MTSTNEAFDRFWTFSLDRYGRPGVSEACLELQESLRVDVNILLLCLWTAHDGQQLATNTLSEIIDGEPGSWHRDVVVPIRLARKAMKGRTIGGDGGRVEAARDRVKAVEIACEKLEQQLLVDAVAGKLAPPREPPTSIAARQALARGNLLAYVALIAPDTADDAASHIETLVESCIA